MTSTARIRSRRISQFLFLACFVVLFFVLVDAPYGADQLAYRMRFPRSPVFLLCLADPLASLSAFVASRGVSVLMVVPVAVAALCLAVPRFFCSHVCPMGTLIDLAGALRGKRRARSLAKLKFIKYGLLGAAVLFAVFAIPANGLLAPLPILTRGLRAATETVAGRASIHLLWSGVLLVIMALSLIHRRFWCNYLCPTGALLSIVSRFSRRRRTKTDACTECGECAAACSFDAVSAATFDAGADCAYCGECARACPAEAVRFGSAGASGPVDAGRREFIAGACVAGGLLVAGRQLTSTSHSKLHRPPGSLPEEEFLARCVRCGLCAQNCPGPAIRMVGLSGGLAAYGTPEVVPRIAGCSLNCNNCGRVCPTGAIRHLPLDEKNRVVMGTAGFRKELCLPHREEENCLVCYEACRKTGYNAIELEERMVYLDNADRFMEENRAILKIPHVDREKCVGCGLCVTACMEENVTKRRVLPRPAIAVEPESPQRRLAVDAEAENKHSPLPKGS